MPRVPLPLRIAFYAFIFSLPFEGFDLPFPGGRTVSAFIGYGFLAVAAIHPRISFRFPPLSFWFFALYILAFVALAVYHGIFDVPLFYGTWQSRLISLTQMLVLFWISANLLRDPKLAKGTIWMLAVGTLLLALSMVAGFVDTEYREGAERGTAFGQNPNVTAGVLSLGLLCFLGLAYGQVRSGLKVRLLTLLAFGVVGMALVRTGSRGALAVFILTTLLLLLKDRKPLQQLKISAVVLVLISLLAVISYQIEYVRVRWESTFVEGSLAGRERIFPESVRMTQERPITGWGPVRHIYELGARLDTARRSPHNLYLYVHHETGIFGAVPFLLGVLLCLAAAWRGRRSALGLLPLALLVYMLGLNLNATWQNRKQFWLALALAQATPAVVLVTRQRKRPFHFRATPPFSRRFPAAQVQAKVMRPGKTG